MTRRLPGTRGPRTQGGTSAAAADIPAGSQPRGGSGPLAAIARAYAVPLVALLGLVAIALLSLKFFGGTLPVVGKGGDTAGDSANGGISILAPGKTVSPSAPPEVSKDISTNGSLVFVKAGNLWIRTGTDTRQLTKTGRDSQPAWSADGKWIYFIETRETRSEYPSPETNHSIMYDLTYPILTRIHPDGSNRQKVLSGLFGSVPTKAWFYFIKTPAVSPDGRTVAVCSDGADPSANDVVLQLIDVNHAKMTKLALAETKPLGHQDPSWSPDGRYLVYVKNETSGGPVIWRYDTTRKSAAPLTNGGYTQPIYSPDGRYLAAVKTNSVGTNVVVLDAATGGELVRVTSDGRSWGPAWSPDGTQLAFMVLAQSGLTTDIHLATLNRAPNGSLDVAGNLVALTSQSGLDGDSRPAWWGSATPPATTPSSTPTTAPSDSPTPSPSASGASH